MFRGGGIGKEYEGTEVRTCGGRWPAAGDSPFALSYSRTFVLAATRAPCLQETPSTATKRRMIDDARKETEGSPAPPLRDAPSGADPQGGGLEGVPARAARPRRRGRARRAPQ